LELVEDDVLFIEILTEGSNEAWAEEFGLGFPIVMDNGENIYGQYLASAGSFGIPTYAVIDRHMRIQLKQVSHGEAINLVQDLILEELPDVEWPMPDVVLEAGDPNPPADEVDGSAAGSPFAGYGSPYGGASCSAGAGRTGLLGLLLGLLGLAFRRR
jgi:hypothetical protein